MTVLLDCAGARPVGYAAFADGWLRHFGVHPAWWGTGRATDLHARALADLEAAGATTTHLWVLVENFRARAFYRREGWEETSIREAEVFEPYPVKMQMTRSRRTRP
jgi:GNAT superfamily N-acetyltransferase